MSYRIGRNIAEQAITNLKEISQTEHTVTVSQFVSEVDSGVFVEFLICWSSFTLKLAGYSCWETLEQCQEIDINDLIKALEDGKFGVKLFDYNMESYYL